MQEDEDPAATKAITQYLADLGIPDGHSAVYLYLLRNGPQSVLALSRGLNSGRTRLYPILESLAARQLVTIHQLRYGSRCEARQPEALEFLVAETERKAEALRSGLAAAMTTLGRLAGATQAGSRVVEYRGIEGVKQINWNLLKAHKEYRVFSLPAPPLDQHFWAKLLKRQRELKITGYDLTNNPDWQQISKINSVHIAENPARYIDPAVFHIEFELLVYNDCVALVDYDEDDAVGVEIHNAKLARQQTQLFDHLWSQALPLDP